MGSGVQRNLQAQLGAVFEEMYDNTTQSSGHTQGSRLARVVEFSFWKMAWMTVSSLSRLV